MINGTNAETIERRCAFWNMTFSILVALESAIMLMIVTRVIGAEDAGILSIAFATAYLMSTIGMYGVRNFHVTDSKNCYSYKDYGKVRLICCTFMLCVSLIYCFWKSYDEYKTSIILMVCLLKLGEAVEDLYHGELQRIGRLDIAGLLGTFRLIITYCLFGGAILFTRNLFISISLVVVLTFITTIVTRIFLGRFLDKKRTDNKGTLFKILISCFPLFLMSFLSIYISNAPKYAIDNYLSEEKQALYAIISMPLFTINVLSEILYRPQLFHMAELWNTNNRIGFRKLIWKQVRNIVVVTAMIAIGGALIGLKVLEILYGVSLDTLKKEFIILLISGGIVAVYNFFTACLTIIRKQAYMIGVSIFIVLTANFISAPLVQYEELTGASYLYLILMLGEMGIVSIILYFGLHSKLPE